MSKIIPHDEGADHQFDDLPVPDQEQSWQKMKELLDREEKKRFLSPLFLRSCAGWGLATLLVAFSGYYFFFSETEQRAGNKDSETTTTIKKSLNGPAENAGKNAVPETIENFLSPKTDQQEINTNGRIAAREETKRQPAKQPTQAPNRPAGSTTPDPAKQEQSSMTGTIKQTASGEVSRLADSETLSDQNDLATDGGETLEAADQLQPGSDRMKKDPVTGKISLDSMNVQPADSADKRNAAAPDSSANAGIVKKWYLSAGLGVQQQVAVGGQHSVPYNHYGRKNSVSDYIPSLFLRFHKEDKWFLMAEFRYGAPQVLKDLSYSRKSFYDTASMVMSTTTMRVMKTYYHQLPVSFNYYIKPGWSVGAGAMYSKFSGAVTESETKNLNVQTMQETVSKKIMNVNEYTDSFLYKTQVHLVFQTDFQWKNFMLGVRYTKDVQPYIRYTSPDGVVSEAKNFTLQAILRYQFWRSRK